MSPAMGTALLFLGVPAVRPVRKAHPVHRRTRERSPAACAAAGAPEPPESAAGVLIVPGVSAQAKVPASTSTSLPSGNGTAPVRRRTRKPKGYWLDLSNLQAELEAHAAAEGLPPGLMPTARALRATGRRDLDNAITNAGGYRVVAHAVGFAAVSEDRKPHGYWNRFANVEAELRAFASSHMDGAVDRMPTLADLRAARRVDLQVGIERHGGFVAVAERLGLRRGGKNRRPSGYWKNWDLVAAELRQFVARRNERQEQMGEGGKRHTVMPSQGELVRARRSDLAQAISDFHGGFAATAARMGYRSRHRDWTRFHVLAREIYSFIRAHNNDLPVMPTTAMLRAQGRTDLMQAISKFDGMSAVAARLGLQYAMRPREAFRDWKTFRRVLLAFAEVHGFDGRLPSSVELQKCRRPDLYQAILWHGGPGEVAMKSRLRPTAFWQDFHCVGRLLLEFIETHGSSGVVR